MWRSLLAPKADELVAPWAGGRMLAAGGRRFRLEGALPREAGWHRFAVSGGRAATAVEPADPPADWPGDRPLVRGYLVGDRLIADGARFCADTARIHEVSTRVLLAERGLGRFARVAAATWGEALLVYAWPDLPQGADAEVERRYEDRAAGLVGIREVTPGLELAFRLASWLRDEAERARARQAEWAEAARVEAEAAARRHALERTYGAAIGDADTRRALARRDFGAAARAALLLSGAELLDWLPAPHADEAIVRYRHRGHRLERVVNRHTLRVIDAGVCLTDHDGEKGDDRFTLESLPGVIQEAEAEQALVIFRRG